MAAKKNASSLFTFGFKRRREEHDLDGTFASADSCFFWPHLTSIIMHAGPASTEQEEGAGSAPLPDGAHLQYPTVPHARLPGTPEVRLTDRFAKCAGASIWNPHTWLDAKSGKLTRLICDAVERVIGGDFGKEVLPARIAAKMDTFAARRAAQSSRLSELNRLRGKTVDDVCYHNNFTRTHGVNNEDLLECTVCKANPPFRLAAARAGSNSTRGELGVISAGQQLCDIKKAVLRHTTSKGHQRALTLADRRARNATAKRGAGMAVGRCSLFRVQEKMSHKAFERLLLLNHLNGVDIGQMNHSEHFSSAMNLYLWEALLSGMREYFAAEHPALGGRRVPFSVGADKATNNRRTGQVVGAVVIDMGTGELKHLMVANGIVTPAKGDAKGLLESIILALSSLVDTDELRERIAAFMFDGAYINWNIHEQIESQLEISTRVLTCTWDGMHHYQCALDDVRTDRPPARGGRNLFTVEWYGAAPDEVGLIVNNHQWGNGYEELRQLAAEHALAMRQPKKFCETRMVQSELKVYDAFILVNWPLYVMHYTEASAIPVGATVRGKARVKRNAAEAAALVCLDKLLDMAFVCTLLVLVDLLKLVMFLSLEAQKVGTLP